MSHDRAYTYNDDEPQDPLDRPIIDALERFPAQPTARFYERIASMPWRKGEQQMIKRGIKTRAFAAGVITTLILALSLLVATPPLRAATAELLGIERADSNILYTTEASSGDVDFAEFGDLLVAEALTPYKLREPTTLPENYRFAHGKHWPDRDMIELIYRRPHPTDSRRTDEPILEVGAGAMVEAVDIGGREGYYFSGAWRSTMPRESIEADQERRLAEIVTELERLRREATDSGESQGVDQERRLGWSDDGSAQRLRWRDGDVVLELSAGWGVFTRAQMIEVAESVAVVEE
jgi:hypothetical protein